MKEAKRIVSLIANAAVFLGCNGFVPPSTSTRSCRTKTTINGIPGVNDYFDSFNDGSDKDKKKSVGGVGDYLNSLSSCNNNNNNNNIKSVEPDASISNGSARTEGGMFDVQSNYFDSLGAKASEPSADDSDAGDVPASSSSPTSSSSNVGELWDAAAALNFNIGPAPAETEDGIDPWQQAAAMQQNFDAHDEDEQDLTIRMTYEEFLAHHKARLCPKMLLTQRAIQSFIFLCEECRDPHSGKWLEDFLQLQNLGNYHGTGAFNTTMYPTWDAVLYGIMTQPNEKMIVSAKRRGRGHGGWSKNNPYLQERYVEFKIDIRPASLVQRLLPVREQLAEEFETYLDIVRIVDEQIMQSYFHNLRGAEDVSAALQQSPSFDRVSAGILTNLTDFQGSSTSPLFRGNFDLLYSLCTQLSAYRLLHDLQSYSSNDPTSQWFQQFYANNVPLYFDGDQPFGRADDFLDLVLSTPPSLVLSSDTFPPVPLGWTDPLWVAERIIAIRSEIASEWKDVMGEVKGDHSKLSTNLFRVMMGRTIEESGNDIIEIEEEVTFDDLSDSAGAFE